MGALFGGSTSPATFSTGGDPRSYIPTAQPQFDALTQSLIGGFGKQIAAGTTPGQANLPLEQTTLANIATNPYAQQAITGAQTGGGYGTEAAAGAAAFLPFLSSMPQELSQQFIGPLEGYAQNIAGLAPQVSSLAGQVAGYMPQVAAYAPQIAQYAPQIAAGIAPLQQGAQRVMQTAFDPQSALYNQLLNQTQQQAAVANAQTGAYGPYAAGSINDAIRNYNINWQNQQLARQTQGLGAAGTAYGTAGQLGIGAGGLYGAAGQELARAAGIGTEAGQLYGTAGQLYDRAGNLTNQAAQLYLQDPKLIQDILSIGGGAGELAAKSAALPYQTYLGQQQAIQGAITPALTQEQQQYTLPQLTIEDINQYLQTAQAAQKAGVQEGQIGFQEAMQRQQQIGSLIGMGLGAVTGGLGGGGLGAALGGLGGGGGLLGLFGGGGGGGGGLFSPDFSSSPSDIGGIGGFFGGLGTSSALPGSDVGFTTPLTQYGGLSLSDLQGLGAL